MSDVAIRSREGDANAMFQARTVSLLLAIGIAGFVGMLILGAYAPDLRSGGNGGAHALSNGATGYSAIVRLAQATGRQGRVVRSEHALNNEDLLVITPESGSVNIGEILARRISKPTLVVLPKWTVQKDPGHSGWVHRTGLIPRFEPEGVIAPGWEYSVERRRSGGRPIRTVVDGPQVSLAAPRPIQVIAKIVHARPHRGEGSDPAEAQVHPLLTDGRGGIVLASLGTRPVYLLADPDLLNNHGLKDPRQAGQALALLDWLNSGSPTGIDFDVTLNGFGHSSSPLKLAFDPPFLSITLTIASVLLLVGLHALGRFGPTERRERAIAFGKAALVDNSAAMIRRAGYEARLGLRYAAVIRDRAVATFGVPARLRDQALDNYLDRLSEGEGSRRRFTDLVRAADAASDRASLVDAAQALHHWLKERLG